MQTGMKMKFTDKLWQEANSVYKQTLDHPFIQEMAEGTLKKETFRFYLGQDLHFLESYSKAFVLWKMNANSEHLSIISDAEDMRTQNHDHKVFEAFFDEYNIKKSYVERNFACAGLSEFLVSIAARKGFGTSLSTLLACEMFYHQVAKYIHENSKSNNPYQKWIDCHVTESYSLYINKYIDLTNKVAEEVSPVEYNEMFENFVITARLEFRLWDHCYHGKTWPLPSKN